MVGCLAEARRFSLPFHLDSISRRLSGVTRLAIAGFAIAAIVSGAVSSAHAAVPTDATQGASEIGTGSASLSTGSASLLQSVLCLFFRGTVLCPTPGLPIS
jgi:hypothetical protein